MITYRSLALSAVLVVFCTMLYSFLPNNHMNIPDTPSYKDQWAAIQKDLDKGLTKSALQKVDDLYLTSKKENNSPQIVKTLIYKANLSSVVEENSYSKNVELLEENAKAANFPLNAVLYSVVAETYFKYYETNAWNINQRTELGVQTSTDFKTWTRKDFYNAVIKNINLSLKSTDELKKVPISHFKDVLTDFDNSDENLRPTLYEFLAYRSINFLDNYNFKQINFDNDLAKTNNRLIGSSDQFLQIDLTTKNNEAIYAKMVRLYQDLLRFRLIEKNKTALFDLELNRLDKMLSWNGNSDSKAQYFNALNILQNKFKDIPESTNALYKIAQYHQTQANRFQNEYEQSLVNNDNYKKAVRVCNMAIERFPKSVGANNCKYLKSRIEKASLQVLTNKVLIPNQKNLAQVTYKNASKLYVKVLKPEFDDYKAFTSSKKNIDIIKYLKKQNEVATYAVDLIDKKDYNLQTGEFIIPELPLGFYVVFTSLNEDFSLSENITAYNSFWVSNISYLTQSKNGEQATLQFLHRKEGYPLKGVEVLVYQSKYDYKSKERKKEVLGNFTSDENGVVKLKSTKSRYSNYTVEANYNNDWLKEGNYRSSNYIRSFNDKPKTNLFTDRSIYRPGQTVHFKGIVIKPSNNNTPEILTNFKSTVQLFDANREKVSELSLVTNEFGSYSGSFVLPKGLLNGNMHIIDASTNSPVYFSVEEYKRPKFEVNVNDPTKEYSLNETVTIDGLAKTFSGVGLENASVKYRVTRGSRFMGCYSFYNRYFSSPQEIDFGVVRTNDKGEFKIDVNTIADASIDKMTEPIFNFTLYIDVTDANGETQSTTAYLVAGYSSLRLSSNIGELIYKSSNTKLSIEASNLSGEELSVPVEIKLLKLETPSTVFIQRDWSRKNTVQLIEKELFNKTFPYLSYNNENELSELKSLKEVLSKNIVTKQDSVININTNSWANGAYRLVAKAKDKVGKEVILEQDFKVYSKTAKKVPTNELILFELDKTSYEPGETAVLTIGTKAKGLTIFYVLEDGGKTNEGKRFKLSDELQKINISITESSRGNLYAHVYGVYEGTTIQKQVTLTVPFTNKQLDFSLETFRDKLTPGGKEEWKIKLKGHKANEVEAELLASMYDASLDAFKPHNWYFNNFKIKNAILNTSFQTFGVDNSRLYNGFKRINRYINTNKSYNQLNWFGGQLFYGDQGLYEYNNVLGGMRKGMPRTMAMSAEIDYETEQVDDMSMDISQKSANNIEAVQITDPSAKHKAEPVLRTNFSELAFFYPQVKTNTEGEALISFTVPDALTKWKFMALAHTKSLASTIFDKEFVANKDLMVEPNLPRFFREGDELTIKVKITNLTDKAITGSTTQILVNKMDGDELLRPRAKSFSVEAESTTIVEWEYTVPMGVSYLRCKTTASANEFSDGEEQIIPVLPNRKLVTEAMPLTTRANETVSYTLSKLKNNNSATLKNYSLSLEYTSNPVWYVVQALPYMKQQGNEACAEQLFTRYYANLMASHIANSNPKIKKVVDLWSKYDESAFISKLQKNEELKEVLLEETPWVFDAQNEQDQKRRISMLFDLNNNNFESVSLLKTLKKLQLPSGAWPWMKGMRESRYITQHIISGMGKLKKLGVLESVDQTMLDEAISYLDYKLHEDYQRLLKSSVSKEKYSLSSMQQHYFYARSYFKTEVNKEYKKAYDFYLSKLGENWVKSSSYQKALVALTSHRLGNEKLANEIMASLKETAVLNKELGMYWKDNSNGYNWDQAKIETQALLIEAFSTISKDQTSVNEMKIWLLKNKQTNNWKTSKATAEACYAMLLEGDNLIENENKVTINVGKETVNTTEASQVGTGYIKKVWQGAEVNQQMAEISVKNSGSSITWGGVYWQYFEDLDKITDSDNELEVRKELYIKNNSSTGEKLKLIDDNVSVKLGDKITVRVIIKVDRDMEYVHMKDMRASGVEPINVFSGYRYKNGLGYYESTKDASTNFFFDYLPKGTYVFEYELKTNVAGTFSNGITTLQCMYAPEFTSHSKGSTILIK